MSNEWLELAWINCTKAILHGQFVDRDGGEHVVEQVLTAEQQEAFYVLNAKHDAEKARLLRSFVRQEGGK